MLNSGYQQPVVKFLIPDFYDLQYVSDTTYTDFIDPASDSMSYDG